MKDFETEIKEKVLNKLTENYINFIEGRDDI